MHGIKLDNEYMSGQSVCPAKIVLSHSPKERLDLLHTNSAGNFPRLSSYKPRQFHQQS